MFVELGPHAEVCGIGNSCVELGYVWNMVLCGINPASNVTSYRRRIDVVTSPRRHIDVVSTSIDVYCLLGIRYKNVETPTRHK